MSSNLIFIRSVTLQKGKKMFKKCALLVLMIVSAGGMLELAGYEPAKTGSDDATVKVNYHRVEVDHSSKEALVKSLIYAINDRNVEAFFECMDESSRKIIQKQAEREKKSLEEMLEFSKKIMLMELKNKYNNDMNKLVEASIKGAEKRNAFVLIDGKWYIHFR